MKIFDEKRAESFLISEGFDVIAGFFIKNVKELQLSLKKFGFPVVMKVSGVKILHKSRVGGVKIGINTYSDALINFKKFRKLKASEGVLIQKQGEGKEFLIGVKLSSDFGHVIGFGAGGVDVEKKRDASFRVFEFNKKEALNMIKEVRGAKGLSEKDRKSIVEVLFKVNKLIKKYPRIREMDINPLMVKNGKSVVVDARIVWG